jgi:hypothetical protein
MENNIAMGRSAIVLSLTVALSFVLLTAGAASADDSTGYYFYKGYDYGTQANYNPGNVIINGGYGIWQVWPNSMNRQVVATPYRQWWRNTWRNIRNPFATIERFGLKRFLETEIYPSSLKINDSPCVPNYFLHGIGAGMHYRETAEWFQWHGFAHPRAWSFASMYAYHLLSEVVENNGSTALSVDPVADLYIFDPLGIALFSSDRVCRFFSEKLELSEWSLQPAYNARTGNLENMGQFYIIRWPLVHDKRWSLLVHGGLHGMAGLSRRFPDGRSYSLAGGLVVEDLRTADQGGPGLAKTATTTWTAGFFYDRNNSLLLSLTGSVIPHNRLRLNVYPGLLRLGKLSPGLFLCDTGEWAFGLSLRWCPVMAYSSRNR